MRFNPQLHQKLIGIINLMVKKKEKRAMSTIFKIKNYKRKKKSFLVGEATPESTLPSPFHFCLPRFIRFFFIFSFLAFQKRCKEFALHLFQLIFFFFFLRRYFNFLIYHTWSLTVQLSIISFLSTSFVAKKVNFIIRIYF